MFLKTPLHTQTDKYNGNFIYEYPTDSVTYTTAENDEIVSLQTVTHKTAKSKGWKSICHTQNSKQQTMETRICEDNVAHKTSNRKRKGNVLVETVTHKTAKSKG